MCVIAIKKRKTTISYETVQDMFRANPDGAGYAIVEMNSVTISKGYNKLDAFWNAINQHQDQYLVLHFRIATQGKITAQMCHPFIITDDLAESCATETITDKPVLFHNGSIGQFGNKDISDTADFATSVLPHIQDTETKLKLLKETAAKYVLIADNKVYRVGEYTKYKGLKVSNRHFIPRPLASDYSCKDSYPLSYADEMSEYFYREKSCARPSKVIPIYDEFTGLYYEYNEDTDEYLPIMD